MNHTNRSRGAVFGTGWTLLRLSMPVFAGACLLFAAGCQTPEQHLGFSEIAAKPPTKPEVIVLQEGDGIRITFPGAPNLNTVQTIRRDGRITLPLKGEFKASGLTPPELEKQLLELYGPELQTKEVSVAVETSAFVVYVTGAVLRPGRIQTDRPVNILSAVMEAGGFDYNRASLKAVRVIRTQNGQTENFTVNVKRVLDGQENKPFTLKPGDIVHVPERFRWF